MKIFFFLFFSYSLYVHATSAPTESEKSFTIGIVQNHVFTDMYQLTYEQAIISGLKKYPNIRAIIKDSEGRVQLQKEQINHLIKQKVDAIILWPVHGKKLVESVKKAHAADIPVIISNSNIHETGYEYITAYSGPDNTLEGQYAAEIMCERLKTLNIHNKAQIVEIMGVEGYTTAIERSTGFRNRFTEICPNTRIIDTAHGNWNHKKSYEVMKDFLSKHKTIHGVFSGDDNMGVGALKAAKEKYRHRDMIFVGATNFAIGYNAMQSGEYWGSVYQSPVLDAENALKTTMDVLLNPDEVHFLNYFDTPKITQENLMDFVKPLF